MAAAALPPLAAIAWPSARLGDALVALARHARLLSQPAADIPSAAFSSGADAGEWIESAAKRLGCEAASLETSYRDLEGELAAAFPALLRITDALFLAVIGRRGRRLRVLTPALSPASVPIRDVCTLVREPLERNARPAYEQLLAETALSASRRAAAISALLAEQLGDRRFDQCWILRASPGQDALRSLRDAGAFRNGFGLVAAHTIQYLLWLASWTILGRISLSGRMDCGWLLAWALLLITLVPFRVLATWKQGLLAIGVGGFFKRRLLSGALRLAPEEMRTCGIGSFLSQTFEAELVETFALSGGVASLLSVIELAVSAVVLGRLALVLLLCFVLAVLFGWQFLRRFRSWTNVRMDMTHDLVESMVGHRTRIAQLPRHRWHESEDQSLDNYLSASRSLDNIGTALMAAVPRIWLLAALACLAPALIAGQSSLTQTAVALGGILLAYTAFRRLVGSFGEVAGACVVWERISPLFQAAARPEELGHLLPHGPADAPETIIEADRLTFRYRREGNPALQGCGLSIRRGDRILLEGPSGGGKTTFASLLSGMRQPESGLLLAGGLDRATLGAERWRKYVASAPQFHENHILTETLAFNLLMGRRWPPTAADMEEAELLCRQLGLGDLLDTMPSGILQSVGEGGWQLSHGERSRVFIARALLQNADLIILDESFAALDPENLRTALECTLEHARTLMVIAHP